MQPRTALLALWAASQLAAPAQVGVGTITPQPSAQLDVTSTTLGFLPPRMTQAQREAIATPAAGLLVYQTDGSPGLYCHDGTAWSTLSGKESALTFGAPFSRDADTISLATAGATTGGTLSSADWANFNTAYGWGNHASAGYLTSFTETDPLFSASAAHGIAAGDITAWNGKVGGSGTASYVPKFTASGTVGNSALCSDATGNVGIGTTTPAYKLDVAGSLNATAITINGTPVASSTDTYWSTAGSGAIQYSGGNVGVNTAAPAYTLDVGGDVNVTGSFRINGALLGGTGTVTSIAGSGGSTGLTVTGGPVTTAGTLTLGGTLAVASGGTGATTAADARTALGLTSAATQPFTTLNTVSTLVQRDAAGNFAAGTITATLTGTASKATSLVGGNATTLLGAMPYQSAADTTSLLVPNTTTTKKFLRMTGTGTNGAAPAWDTVVAGDIASGTVAVANGGTGLATYAIGDLPYASAATTLAKLADVATGSALISGGVGVAPAWGKVGLTTHVTGTLPIANGGTNATTAIAARTNLGLGTASILAATNANTASTVVQRDALGDFSAGTITATLSGSATNVTGTVAVANGGTGATTAAAARTNLGAAASGANTDITSLSGLTTDLTVAQGGTGASTLTGYVKGSGTTAMTASATVPGADISGNITGSAANVTGTVAVANGGTGATTAATARTALAAAAKGANSDITSLSGLTTALSVAQGGTGQTTAATYTSNYVLFGNGTTTPTSESALTWDSTNNRLGIGTSGPSYPLTVYGGTSYTTSGSVYWLASGGALATTLPRSAGVSAYFDQTVVAPQIYVISDARIKRVIDRSDPEADLATLQQVKITDYSYIDVLAKGDQPRKGIIAQELEQVFSNAVKQVADFIPSVYALADTVSFDAQAETLTLTVPQPHGLAVGDIVRVHTDSSRMEKAVVRVVDANTFVLGGVTESADKVFVFGKRVDDFHTVDFDQLSALNVSATQALARHCAALEAENVELKARNADILRRVEALEAK